MLCFWFLNSKTPIGTRHKNERNEMSMQLNKLCRFILLQSYFYGTTFQTPLLSFIRSRVQIRRVSDRLYLRLCLVLKLFWGWRCWVSDLWWTLGDWVTPASLQLSSISKLMEDDKTSYYDLHHQVTLNRSIVSLHIHIFARKTVDMLNTESFSFCFLFFFKQISSNHWIKYNTRQKREKWFILLKNKTPVS